MSIIKNILTAVRGGVSETGEAIVKSQSIRILEQKMRDAQNELDKSAQALASIMAERSIAEKEIIKIDEKIAEYGGYITECLKGAKVSENASAEEKLKAMNKSNVATELAQKISTLESELNNRKTLSAQFLKSETAISQKRLSATSELDAIKGEISLIKAQASVMKATKITAELIGSRHNTDEIEGMIEKVKKAQEFESDKLDAQQQIAQDENDDSLEGKLQEIGLKKQNSVGVAEILARFQPAL